MIGYDPLNRCPANRGGVERGYHRRYVGRYILENQQTETRVVTPNQESLNYVFTGMRKYKSQSDHFRTTYRPLEIIRLAFFVCCVRFISKKTIRYRYNHKTHLCWHIYCVIDMILDRNRNRGEIRMYIQQ